MIQLLTMKTFLNFFLFFFCTFTLNTWACPPSVSEMNRLYHDYLVEVVSQQETRLVFFPFQDGSMSETDPTLQNAFPFALYHFLARLEKTGSMHPFAVMNELDRTPLRGPELFDEVSVSQVASKLKATHAIAGMFQKQGDQLRYFVKVIEVKNNQIVGGIQEFQAQLSNRFFSAMGDTSQSIASNLGSRLQDSQIRASELQTPTFESFRYYVKGMEKSRGYDEVDLGVAKVWLEKSSTSSYTYKPALEDLVRVLAMQSLWNRQVKRDSSLLWSEVNTIRQRLGTSPATIIKNKKGAVSLPVNYDRWLKANQFFVEGIGLAQSNQSPLAISSFEKLLQLTPEDGVAHKILADLYAKAGNSKASTQQSLATQIGACVP